MAVVTINERVWNELVQVAKRRRKKPDDLADTALREYLERQADEELLARSSRAAQKQRLSINQTEQMIREHRQRKKTP